jgi:5-methylthioadenosine/S-adenosylhomocysteine deaminase
MLDEAGLLKDEQYPQILSHGVHLTEEDIQILAGRTAGIINTPVSEMKINDGLAPLAELLEAGVPVGLGTDGALWNNCNDLFREMRAAVFLGSLRAGPASIRPEDALNMGTISGATVFGLEKEIGSLAVGKRADFLVLDIHQPHFTPLLESEGYDNLASLIVFNASGRDVSDVFVQGRRVVRERRVTTLDLPALMDDVNERAAHWTKKLR